MPLFTNRDRIFAHQVHLLEHKLRSKEERILELETENALLHLRLAECLGKLRRDDEDFIQAQKLYQQQKHGQKNTQTALAKLLSEVQVLKQDLQDVSTVYLSCASELEQHSRELQERVCTASSAPQGDPSSAPHSAPHGDSSSAPQEDPISAPQGDPSSAPQGDPGQIRALQAQVDALERSLQEEKDRCKAERLRRKILHNDLVELRGNIRVHCRVRPVLPFDSAPGQPASGPTLEEEIVHVVNDDSVLVNLSKSGSSAMSKMFEFERVHGPEASQDNVFDEIKPLLTSLLDGYNVCIMAYGQTGSGKTHTMIGTQTEDPVGPEGTALQGIIPKAATELFRLISEKPVESHTVEVSVVEVYNNEVFDLLSRDGQGGNVGVKRDVITTSTGTSEVPALTYGLVCSSADVMQVLSPVLRLRAHSPTLVHRDSSRSHLIVTLTVTSKSPTALELARRLHCAGKDAQRSHQKEWWSPRCRRAASGRRGRDEQAGGPASSPCHSPYPSPRSSVTQTTIRTKLQLVDLAGSECVGMSGVTGAALWETSCINRSLSALSDVLGALAERRPHVPYRNSKLTHLLQDSIGGDAKLLVMLCVSPTQRFLAESLQCLGFGTRARQVQREPAQKKNGALKIKRV